MRIKRNVSLLKSTLNNVALRPLVSPQCHRRQYTSSAITYPEQIAVLGGGISGLASAYFVNKEFPNSKITVFESTKETGGWVRSRRVNVPGGDVLFEYGPRTLRTGANALPTAQLVDDLGLETHLLYPIKNSPASKNRYVYYPDRLNSLPSDASQFNLGNLFKLWQSGIMAGSWSFLTEHWTRSRHPPNKDESVGDFISRRFDKRVADNLVSAVFHGIYAGDIYQLSAKTLIPMAHRLESKYGSILRGFLKINQDSQGSRVVVPWTPYELEEYKAMKQDIDIAHDLRQALTTHSMFYFKDGLQTLTQQLSESLTKNKQIEIRTESPVKSFQKVKQSTQIEVVVGTRGSPNSSKFDFVVSTLPDEKLTDSVTVMVVNLWFRNPKLVPVEGFGYLIPRTVPFEQNPERALGVIFDHDATQGQDTVPGTKLTVMLGGHWWNGWEGFPDQDEGANLAKAVLRRHLGIKDEPDACHVTLNSKCIPQYTVGYEDRLKTLAEKLQQTYNGRLRVVGSQYNGVGVNDCIKGAWNIAREMKGNGWRSRGTGLDRVFDEREWLIAPLGSMGERPEDYR